MEVEVGFFVIERCPKLSESNRPRYSSHAGGFQYSCVIRLLNFGWSQFGQSHFPRNIPATNFNLSRRAVDLCDEYDGKHSVRLRCTVALVHEVPRALENEKRWGTGLRWPNFDDLLERLVKEERSRKYVVGIGEWGLNFSAPNANARRTNTDPKVERTIQREVLKNQLQLAEKLALPVVLQAVEETRIVIWRLSLSLISAASSASYRLLTAQTSKSWRTWQLAALILHST